MSKRAVLAWDTSLTKQRASGAYVREPSCPLYNTTRWRTISRVWKATHPFCAECLKQGVYNCDNLRTDHIVPFPICDDFFDTRNLQTLCERHNAEKGNRDRARIQEYKRTHPNWADKFKRGLPGGGLR